MCIRYLGFVLLIWFPGVLHAQSAAQPCSAPSLNGGYVVPQQDTYGHETTLSYGCDTGRKPAVKGWWATITCQNGRWRPEPQCIDQHSCLAPTIAHGRDTENQDGWYKENSAITVTCHAGYQLKGEPARCVKGEWSSLPVCEKTADACSGPDGMPHAVIVHQGYKEVFAANSEVQYECEHGFTTEGDKQSIFCRDGKWTEGPACRSAATSGSYERDSKPPTIRHAFCFVDHTQYPQLFLQLSPQYPYILDKQTMYTSCLQDNFFFIHTCTNGIIITTGCCHRDYIQLGLCG